MPITGEPSSVLRLPISDILSNLGPGWNQGFGAGYQDSLVRAADGLLLNRTWLKYEENCFKVSWMFPLWGTADAAGFYQLPCCQCCGGMGSIPDKITVQWLSKPVREAWEQREVQQCFNVPVAMEGHLLQPLNRDLSREYAFNGLNPFVPWDLKC